MTDKKNPAELYAQVLDLHKKGLITDEMLVEQKKDLLNRPVFKEDEGYLEEIEQWGVIQEKGGITKDELKKRTAMLMNPNKRSVNAPAAAPVKKKKKRGCGCLTMVLLGVGIVGAYSLLSSLMAKNTSNHQADMGLKTTIRQQAHVASRPKSVETVLQQSEPWRAEFTKKISDFGGQEKKMVQMCMNKISAYNEWLIQNAQGNEDAKRALLAFMELQEAEEAKMPATTQSLRSKINEVYCTVGTDLKNGKAFNPDQVTDQLLAVCASEQNRKAVQERINRAKQK